MFRKIFLYIITLLTAFQCPPCQGDIQDCIFRQYDIRGTFGSEIDIDEVYDLSRAIAFYLLHKNPSTKKIAIGMDGRLSSPAIKEKLCEGLQDSGIDVLWIGLCTSPILYFTTHTTDVDGGIMITASHNPKDDNGLKISLGLEPIWGDQLQILKEMFHERKHIRTCYRGVVTHYDVVSRYIDWMAEHFSHLIGKNFQAIIDCGNGAAGAVMPRLIERMQWNNVSLLYGEVDGNFPNRSSDPTKAANMTGLCEALKTGDKHTIGIGFDGDGDRMVAMTNEGYLIPGDKLLGVFSKQVIENHPNASVVFDISSSSGLTELLESIGATPCMAPTGSVYIRDYMFRHQALVGGEISCHFFFKDRNFGYDDGIYAAFRLLEIMDSTSKNLDALIADFPKKYGTETLRMPYEEDKKQLVVAAIEKYFSTREDCKVLTIDGVRATFSYGWGLVRPSNTEPKLSMRFEANTFEDLEKIKSEFTKILLEYFDEAYLKNYLS
ncbi:MAG: phosphomannomutase/phosphoglucomutase [Chlamydiota bacterium]|nr:phosphomannomutase/phosphoglucomutase [Chlamydiota bacterium]